MPRIFISYRRADSQTICGRIYDHVRSEFITFKDSYSIVLGDDFREKIRQEVATCDVMLVIIGKKWLNIKDDEGNRRLDDENDWVRIEVEIGLKRGIPVIPILVNKASLPSSNDLPQTLRELAFKNAITVRDDPDFESDISSLMNSLRKRDKKFPVSRLILALFLAAVLLIGIFAGLIFIFRPLWDNSETERITLTAPPYPVDVAYEFLVDRSVNMSELVGGRTRYNIVRDVIYDIVRAPGTRTPRTWLGLRTAGGGEGTSCTDTELAYADVGQNLSPEVFIQPLDDYLPQGNTAYIAGLDGTFTDMSAPAPADSQIKLLFIFIGSYQPSTNCPTDNLENIVEIMVQNYERANISVVMCVFTLLDQYLYEELQEELEAQDICSNNATNPQEAQIFVEVAVGHIRDALGTNTDDLDLTLTPMSVVGDFSVPTPSPRPTASSTATETPVPTETATPNPNIEARGGPGLFYPVVATFPATTEFEVLGVNENQDWLLIRLSDGSEVWIAISGEGTNLVQDLNNVPVIIMSPFTATLTPTLTPTPTANPAWEITLMPSSGQPGTQFTITTIVNTQCTVTDLGIVDVSGSATITVPDIAEDDLTVECTYQGETKTTTFHVDRMIYVCVVPEDTNVNTTQLIVFNNTTAFGLMIPYNANVMVYSQVNITVSEYTITEDASSGGYRAVNHVATTSASDIIPETLRPCDDDENHFTSQLPATVPLPVSADHALLIQVGSDDFITPPPFLGVVAFEFRPNGDQFLTQFQLIQISPGNIDFSLPFYTEEVQYLLIANKNVSVQRSYADVPYDFGVRTLADDRSDFVRFLGSNELNLFDIMRADSIRIYPLQGLEGTYSTGGYIRLEMAPDMSQRIPSFSPGNTICSIDDETIDYVAFADPEIQGVLQPNELPQVVRIQEDGEFTGQLVVQYREGPELIVDAWLVDVCNP